MKFKYMGPSEEITLREVTFEKGKAVIVSAPDFQAKLQAMGSFQVVKTRSKDNAKNKS